MRIYFSAVNSAGIGAGLDGFQVVGVDSFIVTPGQRLRGHLVAGAGCDATQSLILAGSFGLIQSASGAFTIMEALYVSSYGAYLPLNLQGQVSGSFDFDVKYTDLMGIAPASFPAGGAALSFFANISAHNPTAGLVHLMLTASGWYEVTYD